MNERIALTPNTTTEHERETPNMLDTPTTTDPTIAHQEPTDGADALDRDEDLAAIAAALAIAHADSDNDRMFMLTVDAECIVGRDGIDAWLAENAPFARRRVDPEPQAQIEPASDPVVEPAAPRAHEPQTEKVRLGLIRSSREAQQRVGGVSDELVDEYYEVMLRGDRHFPPLMVFFDGEVYHVADGHHRFLAALKAFGPNNDIRCFVQPGSLRDAIVCSCGANADHGARRTNADKQHAIETLLNDIVWGAWSNNAIAMRCHVSDKTVAKYRTELASLRKSEVSPQRAYTGKHGTTSKMDTGCIGKGKRAAKPPKTKHASPIDNEAPVAEAPVTVAEPSAPAPTQPDAAVNEAVIAPAIAADAPTADASSWAPQWAGSQLIKTPETYGLVFSDQVLHEAEGEVGRVREMLDVPGWVNRQHLMMARRVAMKIAAQWQDLADELDARMAAESGADDRQLDLVVMANAATDAAQDAPPPPAEPVLAGEIHAGTPESTPPTTPTAETCPAPVSRPPAAIAANGEQNATPEAELEEIAKRIARLNLVIPLDASNDPALLINVAKLLERSWRAVQELVPAKDNPDAVFRLAERTRRWRAWATPIHVEKECPFLRQFCKENDVKIALPHAVYQGGRKGRAEPEAE